MTSRSVRLPTLSGLLVAAAVLTTGCSGPDRAEPAARSAPTPASAVPSETPAAPTASPVPSAPAVRIVMADFGYEVPASVPTGAQVTVVNRDAEAHTFTLQGRPEARLVVPPRGSMVFTAPTQPGSYPVVCEFHGGMTTALVVT